MTVGTPAEEQTNAVAFGRSGEVYAAGQTKGALPGTNAGGYDGFVRRLNGSTGATLWTDQ